MNHLKEIEKLTRWNNSLTAPSSFRDCSRTAQSWIKGVVARNKDWIEQHKLALQD